MAFDPESEDDQSRRKHPGPLAARRGRGRARGFPACGGVLVQSRRVPEPGPASHLEGHSVSRVVEDRRYDITDEVRLPSLAEQILQAVHKERRLMCNNRLWTGKQR